MKTQNLSITLSQILSQGAEIVHRSKGVLICREGNINVTYTLVGDKLYTRKKDALRGCALSFTEPPVSVCRTFIEPAAEFGGIVTIDF